MNNVLQSVMSFAVGLYPTQNLGVQLTLFQPEGGGRLYPPPPGFENLTTSLYYVLTTPFSRFK